jgi:hypothetical protein
MNHIIRFHRTGQLRCQVDVSRLRLLGADHGRLGLLLHPAHSARSASRTAAHSLFITAG